MNLRIASYSLAVSFSVAAMVPLHAVAAPSVYFKTPTTGATISGNIYQSSACEVAGSNIKQVRFFLDGGALNSESYSPWNCNIDTTKFANGTHALKAVAYDSAGATASTQISVNIQNGNKAPTVSLTSPSSGATISGASVAIAASAADSDGSVAKVEFLLGSTLLATDSAAPYAATLDTTKFANGAYTLTARATDNAGAVTNSQISVNISNGGTGSSALPPPGTGTLEIWWKAPIRGATVSGLLQQSTCYVKGNGAAKVAFFLDSTALNTDSVMADGMSCVLDTTRFSNGSHTLKAIAYDASGKTYGPEAATINIQNATGGGGTPTNAAPTVSITSPASGATISGSSVAFAANASDSDGTVAKVEFLVGSTLLATDTTNSYATSIDTTKLANGTYTLVARATDNAGAVTSAQTTVNVQNSTGTPTSLPAPGTGTLEIWWKAPINGATVSGQLALDKCYVKGNGVAKVAFFLDSTALNTDSVMADGMSCVLDTTRFSNGSHTLKAIAYDASGKTYGPEAATINIQNATGGGGTPTNAAPTVSISSPADGATISGASVAIAASAADSDGSVAKVEFLLGSTLLATDSTSPYAATLDTTKFANGTYTLTARATDNAGATGSAQRSVKISNATSSLPSTGTKAVPTFEAVGLYWTPGTNPGSAGCKVQYRKQGDSAWKDALPMWYDPRNSECRGSIVGLASGTTYEVQFALPGQSPSRALAFATWSDTFPIARTVNVASSSQPLVITQGGTPDGYVLYTGPATIDVANAADYNVLISAPYVIVRGLTLKNGRVDGIRMVKGAHDVVIEGNDISGWGRFSGKLSSDGWQIGTNEDSAIKAYCFDSPGWLTRTIIQRNKIHDPRYGSNSWSDGHPSGPNAIAFFECGGNHVFRYNDIWSSWGHYYMDAIGGGENFSNKGFPNSDSDIYGNKIQHAWDDAIESEGANANVRVWGNYMNDTDTGVASTSISVGPMYIFRNVWNRSRNLSMRSLDGDSRLYMFKSGSQSGYGDGRRYVFHNTMMQAPPPAGSSYPLGGGQGLASPGGGQNLTNTVSRNNIFHIWKSWWSAIDDTGGGMTPNDLDYDLVNGNVTTSNTQEAHRIVGTPIFAPNNGWVSGSGGMYQLDPSSPGYDRGARIPNFNDNFTGAAPDVGAHEAGMPAMKFGVQ